MNACREEPVRDSIHTRAYKTPITVEGRNAEIIQTSRFLNTLKNLNLSNLKIISKTPDISLTKKTIKNLDNNVAKDCVPKEDEFETFGKHAAKQTTKIPLTCYYLAK